MITRRLTIPRGVFDADELSPPAATKPTHKVPIGVLPDAGEDEDDGRRKHVFRMWKNGGPAKVLFDGSASFLRPKRHKLLERARIVGVDTEDMYPDEAGRELGDYRTVLTTVHFDDRSAAIETPDGRDMMARLLTELAKQPGFAEPAGPPSATVKRGKKKGGGRHARRHYPRPVLCLFFNLAFDLGRLLADKPHVLRAIGVGADEYRFDLDDEWQIEIERLHIGAGSFFEWYARNKRENTILRLLGFDLRGYWKRTLAETATALGAKPKVDIEDKIPGVYERSREMFTDAEWALFREYGLGDVESTVDVYHRTAKLLAEDIDPRVVRSTGVLPPSAPGAAARIMFSQVFDLMKVDPFTGEETDEIEKKGLHPELKEWPRYDPKYDQLGLFAFFGGLVFTRRRGVFRRLRPLDLKSAYARAMWELPDPVTARYVPISERHGFNANEWVGRHGVIVISGEGLDPVMPPFPVHTRPDKVRADALSEEADEHERAGRVDEALLLRAEAHELRQASRLRYVFGRFNAKTVTIAEVVLGVLRGALRVDRVHGGVWIDGSPERSFFRHGVEMFFQGKEDADAKASALEVEARHAESESRADDAARLRVEASGQRALRDVYKLLLVSGYGKLVEATRSAYLFGADIPVPSFWRKDDVCEAVATIAAELGPTSTERIAFWGDEEERCERIPRVVRDELGAGPLTQADVARCLYRQAIGAYGGELEDRSEYAVRSYVDALARAGVATTGKDPVPLVDYMRNVKPYRAGHYFMPLYGACVTGLTRAKLATMGACLGALHGHTDSVHVECPEGVDDPRELPGFDRYQELVARAGYGTPTEGLGAWTLEGPAPSTESVVVRNGVYSHQFVDPITGKVTFKQASHGYSGFDSPDVAKEKAKRITGETRADREKRIKIAREKAFHEALKRQVLEDPNCTYDSRPKARTIKQSIATGLQVGEFTSRRVTVGIKDDPNTEWIDGERRWKPMPRQYGAPTTRARTPDAEAMRRREADRVVADAERLQLARDEIAETGSAGALRLESEDLDAAERRAERKTRSRTP